MLFVTWRVLLYYVESIPSEGGAQQSDPKGLSFFRISAYHYIWEAVVIDYGILSGQLYD